MTLQIAARGVRLLPSFVDAVERKAAQAFDRFERSLIDVRLMLRDLNGPKGGTDKLCRVEIAVVHGPNIIIESRGDDVLSVAGRAIDRAAHAVSRRLERLTNSRHGRAG